jgi:hypothetical protein
MAARVFEIAMPIWHSVCNVRGQTLCVADIDIETA